MGVSKIGSNPLPLDPGPSLGLSIWKGPAKIDIPRAASVVQKAPPPEASRWSRHGEKTEFSKLRMVRSGKVFCIYFAWLKNIG